MRRDILCAHHKIFADRRAVRHAHAVREPPELGRNNIALLDYGVFALAQRFYSVHFGFYRSYVFRIPQRGAAVRRHFAIFQHDRIVVPKRIPQIQKAVARLDRSALFERAFAVGFARKPAIIYFDAFQTVKRALLVHRFIFNLHLF